MKVKVRKRRYYTAITANGYLVCKYGTIRFGHGKPVTFDGVLPY